MHDTKVDKMLTVVGKFSDLGFSDMLCNINHKLNISKDKEVYLQYIFYCLFYKM